MKTYRRGDSEIRLCVSKQLVIFCVLWDGEYIIVLCSASAFILYPLLGTELLSKEKLNSSDWKGGLISG